jgi:hypothetical protein
MRAVSARRTHDKDRAAAHRAEWLIVCRWGARGRMISISTTHGLVPSQGGTRPHGTAPECLAPRGTLVATLVWNDHDRRESSFLVLQRPPRATTLAGQFVPAEGLVTLSWPGMRLQIAATIRFSDRLASAMPLWRFHAAQRSWRGEYIDRR